MAAPKRKLALLLVREHLGECAHRVAEMLVDFDHTEAQLIENYSSAAHAYGSPSHHPRPPLHMVLLRKRRTRAAQAKTGLKVLLQVTILSASCTPLLLNSRLIKLARVARHGVSTS